MKGECVLGPVPERALSPSQIKTWKDCHRKWGLLYVDKRPSKPNRYAQFGTAMHSVAESWLDKSKMMVPSQKTQEGRAFLAGIHHWPSPEFVDAVEGHIETQTMVSKYHGYRDVEFFDQDLGLWIVGDHKSCGSFDYALTEEDLLTDEQAMIYLRSVMDRKQVDQAGARWVYYKRTAPHGSKRVQLVVLRDHVERVFAEQIDPVASEIHAAYEQSAVDYVERPLKTGMAFDPNALSCSKFGGCEFQSVCNLSPMEKMRSFMTQENLLEKMRKKKAEQAAAVGTVNPPERDREPKPVEAAPPVAEASKPTPEVDNGMAARIAAKKAAAQAKTGAVAVLKDPPYEAPKLTQVPSANENGTKSTLIDTTPMFRLLIDCRPMGASQYSLASEIVTAANTVLCEELDVSDYLSVEYGKGRAELAIRTRFILEARKKMGALRDTVVLYTSNRMEADVVGMFMQYASEIIRP